MRLVKTPAYTRRQEGDARLGYWNEFPDYWTQGKSPGDLEDHLLDLYCDLSA